MIQPLWSAGLRSAPQVAYLGRSNLMRRVGAAARHQDRASHLPQGGACHLAGAQRLPALPPAAEQPVAHGPADAAASPRHQRRRWPARPIAMPEWEELFGSPDACECSHCESAISPAAYLRGHPRPIWKRPWMPTATTRWTNCWRAGPISARLRLTCENTETPLPHIDLVNEILEAIVASADGTTLSGAAIGETTWDSDLLAAQPEHLKTAAYDIVRTSTYPFDHAPFDLWAEEGRRYLAQMGIARDELMRVMPREAGGGSPWRSRPKRWA